jgi:hypothetical protein
MANYAVGNSTTVTNSSQVAVTTTDISLVSLFASTIAPAPVVQLRRGKLYDLLVGTNGTPADNALIWSIHRATAGSTSAYTGYLSSVALAIDPADSTPATAVWVNSSAETAYTFVATNLPLYVGVNQRASYRWVAAPGSEIVWPATSSNGIVLRVKSPAYTGTATGSVMWTE